MCSVSMSTRRVTSLLRPLLWWRFVASYPLRLGTPRNRPSKRSYPFLMSSSTRPPPTRTSCTLQMVCRVAGSDGTASAHPELMLLADRQWCAVIYAYGYSGYSNACNGAVGSPGHTDGVESVVGGCGRAVQEEGKRPLREYMGLPPSQYSVLDAQTVTRIDDNTFKCEPTPSLSHCKESRSHGNGSSTTDVTTLSWPHERFFSSLVVHTVATPTPLPSAWPTLPYTPCVDGARYTDGLLLMWFRLGCGRCELAELNFFGFKVQPVLTAQVDVLDEGAGTIIRVTDAHIGGSDVAEAASDTFMGECARAGSRACWGGAGGAHMGVPGPVRCRAACLSRTPVSGRTGFNIALERGTGNQPAAADRRFFCPSLPSARSLRSALFDCSGPV